MTDGEKRNPKTVDQSRRHRIAFGSGTEPREVDELIKAFIPMAEIMNAVSLMTDCDRMEACQAMTGNTTGHISVPKKWTDFRSMPPWDDEDK